MLLKQQYWKDYLGDDVWNSLVTKYGTSDGMDRGYIFHMEEPTKKEKMITNPDIRMIARAGKKMTPEQAENLRKYAQYMFPEAFKDDD